MFAPVAAHLCAGVDLEQLGEAIDPVTLLPGLLPVPREEDGRLVAEVLWVDRFGNAQLNVGPEDIDPFGPRVALRCDDQLRVARRAHAYGELGPGEVGLVVDSYGLVSVAMDRSSAAEFLGLGPGSGIMLAAPE